MVLGKLPVPGHPTILITVGQGPIALAVGAVGGGLDIFTLIYPFSFLSPSLWKTARYKLKYCLKGPLSPKQSTNQSFASPITCFFSLTAVTVPESQEYRNMEMIRERINFTFNSRDMLFSLNWLQICKSCSDLRDR